MTLTVAGGLVELKLLEKRIQKATNSIFVLFQEGKNVLKGYKNKEELVDTIKANNQSVVDLIKRRNKVKSAIVLSNATTKVTVGNETMTVAEAIERKTSIQFDKELLASYKNQLSQTIRRVDMINADVNSRADEMVKTFLSGDNSKIAEASILRDNMIESQGGNLVDPLNIKKLIEELEERIDTFEANVDLALSTSNAITQLDI